jgi:hypothetical protein
MLIVQNQVSNDRGGSETGEGQNIGQRVDIFVEHFGGS